MPAVLRAPRGRLVILLACVVSAAVLGLVGCGSAGSAQQITATCDDTTGDATTLQHAINNSAPGDQILITSSTTRKMGDNLASVCDITSPITLLGNRSYMGESRSGLVLQGKPGLPYLLASDSYVSSSRYDGEPLSVHQLTLDCNGGADGLVLESLEAQAYDMYIQGCSQYGILETTIGKNRTTVLTNGVIKSNIADNWIDDSGASGIYIQDQTGGAGATDGTIFNNSIGDSTGDAIHMQNASGWYILDNHLYGVGGSGIWMERMLWTTVSGNIIEDFGDKGGSTASGIGGDAQGSTTSTISDNKVSETVKEASGTAYHYVAINQANYAPGGYVDVTGNSLQGNGTAGDTGFYFNTYSYPLTVVSSGNLVTGMHTNRAVSRGVTVTAGM